MDRLRIEMLETNALERDLGVLVGGKLSMSQQYCGSQEGHLCPGGTRPSMASPARDGIVLFCSPLGWPHLKPWGSLGHYSIRMILNY